MLKPEHTEVDVLHIETVNYTQSCLHLMDLDGNILTRYNYGTHSVDNDCVPILSVLYLAVTLLKYWRLSILMES